MAANTDQKARLFDLQATVSELVRDGNRDPEKYADILQIIKDKKNFAEILLGEKYDPRPKSLLELVGTVNLRATSEKFVAREWFVEDTSKRAPAKISYVSNSFKEWFLGKTEEPILETAMRYHRLQKSSRDIPIITALGGEEQAETTLTAIYAFMEQQKNGENGALLHNGYANIFYVRDINGILRAVYVYWYGHGWRVYAYSVEHPNAWHDGHLVFSRNC